MGIYKYIQNIWKKPTTDNKENYKAYIMQWRREPVSVRLERPTRLDRARNAGYKAKQGIFVVRQRVIRGGHTRPQLKAGRRPKRFGTKKNLKINYQYIAEKRAGKAFPNCEVLNSYWVGEDGQHGWYEVIMVDPYNPNIVADKNLNWICKKPHVNRVERAMTSAARKSRGLRNNKGKGAEKLRPSLAAHKNRGK